MLKKIVGYLFTLSLFSSLVWGDIEIYLAPEGGFAPDNNKREIVLKSGEKVAPTLNNALLDMIQRTPEGGQIKIAMYAFSSDNVLQALMEAAKERKVKVKLLLDAVASWTSEIRADIKQKVLKEQKLAQQEKRAFDFQIREIYPEVMVARGRVRQLEDGTTIYGTMHEKFGVFYNPNTPVPVHAFCGSSNISHGASEVFAENRVFFRNEIAVARQLAEEFARLWNEFGVCITDNCQSERLIAVDNNGADVRIISNSEPVDETHNRKIDDALLKLLERVDPENGTIDVALFSFTHYPLASTLIYLARKYPKIEIRVLLDQTQIHSDDHHRGVLGPFIENRAKKYGLKNLTVRYKWRSNAYGWDHESHSFQLIHWKNLLLHHKGVVVNGNLMALGSYNWSESAEERNFENIMIFQGYTPEQQQVIDRFLNEYNYIWQRVKPEGEQVTSKVEHPQVVTGPHGRKLKAQIRNVYYDSLCRKIMKVVDQNWKSGVTLEELKKELASNEEKLTEKLSVLISADLLFAQPATEKQDQIRYFLTD